MGKIEIDINIKNLDQLTEALSLLGSAVAYKNNMVNTATEAVKLVINEPEKAPELKNDITREDVRTAFVSKNSPSTRSKLKAILDKYKTPNISELNEEHFDDVLKELEAI